MDTVITLTAIAGAILALALEYVPKLKDWYSPLGTAAKKQIMGGLLVLSAIGAYALGCYSPYVTVACTEAGFWELAGVLVMALLAGTATNQATHMLTKKTKF